MNDPNTIQFAYPVLPFDEYASDEKVILTQTFAPLVNSIAHLAMALLRLPAAPFQKTLNFVGYELFSSVRSLELSLGIVLAAFDKPYGLYLMYVARENISQYDFFFHDYTQHLATMDLLK